MRCRHHNAVIKVEAIATLQRWHYGGKANFNQDYPDLTGVLEVECPDCGLWKRYTRRQWPAWLVKAMESFDGKQDGEAMTPEW